MSRHTLSALQSLEAAAVSGDCVCIQLLEASQTRGLYRCVPSLSRGKQYAALAGTAVTPLSPVNNSDFDHSVREYTVSSHARR